MVTFPFLSVWLSLYQLKLYLREKEKIWPERVLYIFPNLVLSKLSACSNRTINKCCEKGAKCVSNILPDSIFSIMTT